MKIHRYCQFSVIMASVIVGQWVTPTVADETSRPIKVLNPHRLPGKPIAAVRTPLGISNDYKPWITRLDGDKLLLVAFSYGGVPHNKLPAGTPYLERAIFWRSNDSGKSWGAREEHLDVHGREFSLNRLSDGTLLMPCHFLKQDAANHAGHTYSKLFRSVDDGKTWSETRIGPEGFPAKAQTATDWTVVEIPDPEAPRKTTTMFGVSMQHGGKQAPSTVAIWRSRDSGRTWDKTHRPDTAGWIDVDGFFSQSTTYRAKSGKLLHVVRVDATGPHWDVPDLKSAGKESGDQADRMMLWVSTDNGASWRRQGKYGTFGAGGEMYPRFLRLVDGRLLLTFTVRSSSTDGHSLGLRAIVSDDDGGTWRFDRDRLVIDDQNVGPSGGGFGNTVQSDDGTLISCYSYRGQDNKTHIEAVRWLLPNVERE
ncbi:MAG: sialidase family protein [Pirellulaceae bacterium]|nr:sialidase family protein [Pirellulaceae bacterium]